MSLFFLFKNFDYSKTPILKFSALQINFVINIIIYSKYTLIICGFPSINFYLSITLFKKYIYTCQFLHSVFIVMTPKRYSFGFVKKIKQKKIT